MIKNIQEYVVNCVIAHMKYRDLELEQLKEEIKIMKEKLETKDILKCGICKKYEEYDRTCDFCELVSCIECAYVKRYSSWNISGCTACNRCIELYCTMCRRTNEECKESSQAMCQ